jgi:hypothetical protein
MGLALLLCAFVCCTSAAWWDEDGTTATTTSTTTRTASGSSAPDTLSPRMSLEERVAGLGSCPFCPANRTRAGVAAAARGTLVVTLQKAGAAVSDAAGDGGLSRDYEGFAVVEGACPAGRLVQEVSRPDSPGQCDRGEALRVGHTYRLSGQCEGKTFFLDPCGLLERLSREEAGALGAAPPSERNNEERKAEVKRLKRQERKMKKKLAALKQRVAAATARAEAARKKLLKVSVVVCSLCNCSFFVPRRDERCARRSVWRMRRCATRGKRPLRLARCCCR